MEVKLKNKDALAHEIGVRVLTDADHLRKFMDETYAARFPIIWAGKRYSVTVEMEKADD